MNDRRPAHEETRPPDSAQESDNGFRPDLPLAILESVRHHDRPVEVLEDEDLTASLPRRLGLTGVVESQIHRYRLARKRRERIPSEDVLDLLRLVMRRPDCEPILREAGRELAHDQHRSLVTRLASAARILPEGLAVRAARRDVRTLMRRIGGGSLVQVDARPFRVVARDTVTARADKYGIACVLYGTAIGASFQHATGRSPTVAHPECEAKGGERCVWTVEPDA